MEKFKKRVCERSIARNLRGDFYQPDEMKMAGRNRKDTGYVAWYRVGL